MSFLKTLDKFSFKKIFSLGFLLVVALSIPATVLLLSQQTRLSSQAKIEKPPIIPIEKQDYGPSPLAPIEVTRVYPFLGKASDEVVILGKNFGLNPKDKFLSLNNIAVEEGKIEVWQDNLISFFLPEGASSGTIKIRAGSFAWESPQPFIIYNLTTPTQVQKNGQTLAIISPQSITQAKYKLVNQSGEKEVKVATENNIFRFVTEPGEIEYILLYNQQNQLVPFYVNPIEFDF